MQSLTSRPYETADLPELVEFARRLGLLRRPYPPYYHPGDFVWQLFAFDRSGDARVWRTSGGEVAGCAIFEPPLALQFDMDPALSRQHDLMYEVFEWASERRALVMNKGDVPIAYRRLGYDTISTSAYDADEVRVAFLEENGYQQDADESFRLARDLRKPLQAPDPPPGARFRSMTEADADARSELHRDAWSVWGQSTHTSALWRRLRGAPLYEPDLDVVLEVDGELVSYCICWLDTTNRVGLFEPVGTRPSATRRGFGRAVLFEGCRRLRSKGMGIATVGTGTVNRAAMALYASAGFDVVLGREHAWTKRDSE